MNTLSSITFSAVKANTNFPTIESVKACLQYISKHFPDIEINAYIESTNQASIQVAEKAGMVFVEETLYHSLPVRRYVFVGKNCE